MRKAIAATCMAMLLLSACSTLRRGDLLLHVTATPNRITAVTPANIDHVAIYAGGDSVVEAIPHQGVTVTPLSRVLTREDGHYAVARIRHADGRRAIAEAQRYRGLPYDSLYLPGNDAIYCSELVLLAFKGSDGTPLLQPVPMTFRDSTGNIPQAWTQLYERHGISVPEGLPGSNPAELAARKEVRIIIKKLKR